MSSSNKQFSLFRRLFVRGQMDYFGTYFLDSGRYMVRKEPITVRVIQRHLDGEIPLGVFPLVGDQIAWAVVDFDSPDQARVVAFRDETRRHGLFPYVERSKGKGWHVWFFFEEMVEAKPVVTCLRAILAAQNLSAVEVFPKQYSLEPGAFGSFVNCPLFGALTPQGRTVFVRDDFQAYPDQWAFLASVLPTPPVVIHNALSAVPSSRPHDSTLAGHLPDADNVSRTRGLLPCKIRMLAEGVTDNQRLSAFYLAIALKQAGIPEPAVEALLCDWRQRNRPREGRSVITDYEVRTQVRCAFGHGYTSHGCTNEAVTPFCSEECAIRRKQRRTAGLVAGNR